MADSVDMCCEMIWSRIRLQNPILFDSVVSKPRRMFVSALSLMLACNRCNNASHITEDVTEDVSKASVEVTAAMMRRSVDAGDLLAIAFVAYLYEQSEDYASALEMYLNAPVKEEWVLKEIEALQEKMRVEDV